MEACSAYVKKKYEKLEEYTPFSGRFIKYTTKEIICSIKKSPTHLRANYLESPQTKEKWAVLI